MHMHFDIAEVVAGDVADAVDVGVGVDIGVGVGVELQLLLT